MAVATGFGTDVLADWLASGSTVRICGLDFVPIANSLLPSSVRCIVKGQAAVYFLRQQPHGNVWLLKRFSPGRRPSNDYLARIPHCLPGSIDFFTCTQRRMLHTKHVDWRYSGFRRKELSAFLAGSILMPKVPGSPWCSIADDLRDGNLNLTCDQRVMSAAILSKCIHRLEDGGCTHRDLSSGNVFLDENGRVFIIDWDSLYHDQLSFQPNTTVGTPGYMAPFTRGPKGHFEAERSWRPAADRYALGILIAELLLTRSEFGPPHEDGSMFAQSQLDAPGHEFVREQAEALCRLDRTCGCLLLRTLYATSFDECPRPEHWRAALYHFARRQSSKPGIERKLRPPKPTRHEENGPHEDSSALWITHCKEGAAPLASVGQSRLSVACEHCHRISWMPRNKLDALRSGGSPILCLDCLHAQLDRWKQEQASWKQVHPEIDCALCGKTFRMATDRRDSLVAMGKPALCRECLEREQWIRSRQVARGNNHRTRRFQR